MWPATYQWNPEELQKLREHPSLIETAVEEVLRYDSPIQSASRVSKEDLEIGGKMISKGQMITLFIGAANRDPDQFPEPDRLDITRQENKYLAFGFGIHFCLGAALSRLEGQITIGTVLRRMPDLRIATEDLEWVDNPTFRALKSLPVTF